MKSANFFSRIDRLRHFDATTPQRTRLYRNVEKYQPPPESHQIAERGSTDFTYLRIENHHFELGKEKATMLKNIPAILSEGFTAVQRLCLRGSLSYVIVYNGFIFLRFACTVHWDKITLGGS